MLGIDATHVSSTEFEVEGDKTGYFMPRRGVKFGFEDDSIEFSIVESSTYDGNNTTVTIEDAVLNSGLDTVRYGIISGGEDSSLPPHKIEDRHFTDDTDTGKAVKPDGAGGLALDYVSYLNLTNIPSEFTPSEHNNNKHSENYITEVLTHNNTKHSEDYATQEEVKAEALPKVWQAVKTDAASTTSSTFTDAGIAELSITLTPTSINDSFLVQFDAFVGGVNNSQPFFRIMRDGAIIQEADALGNRVTVHATGFESTDVAPGKAGFSFVDTPNTTAEIEYSVEWRRRHDDTAYINRVRTDFDQTNIARGISTLLLTKVRKQ